MSAWPTDDTLDAEPAVASCDDCGASADEECDGACPSRKAAVADEERELDRDHPEEDDDDA